MPYSTPGVYIEEISLFPPSVAEVATAVPAFIGYVQQGKDLKPTRIRSMVEFEEKFGGPKLSEYEVTVAADDALTIAHSNKTTVDKYLMHHQVRMFFANGGGACYIVPVGDHTATPGATDLEKGLTALAGEDEPTLIVFPDAAVLPDAGTGANKKPGSLGLYEKALAQCRLRRDRFLIMELPFKNDNTIRDGIPADNRDYGAAYTPFLETAIAYPFAEAGVTVKKAADAASPGVKLDTMKAGAENKLYNQIKAELSGRTLTLPPGGAVAGVFARVDRDRGVWKAPANVGVQGVLGPVDRLSDAQQDLLNVHDSGKSINAIRSFPGQGTLVWGARTTDGNSNEWKYVNVRRLFVMMEESIQKACAFAVFEPNTASTWLKVKAMIESFLFSLWQRGALAGSSPKEAYFVQVGLNVTMTEADINNGEMIVKVGVAAARPAEFVILQFSHKMVGA